MTEFDVKYNFGCYAFIIRDNDSVTTLYLDAKEMIDLCDAVDFYRKKAEYEISKINKAED
ncbi:MAG: hypothetical protein WC175_05640 [Candidatus Dojkabacteria bacterium]